MPAATPFTLGFVSVHVTDVERARPFCEGFPGLRPTREFPGEVFYGLGGVAPSVHEDPHGECGRLPGGPTGSSLRVPDVARARADVRRAGLRIAWDSGEDSFSVEDPDTAGLRSGLSSPVGPDGNGVVFWAPCAT